jgi:hypothetical protein
MSGTCGICDKPASRMTIGGTIGPMLDGVDVLARPIALTRVAP